MNIIEKVIASMSTEEVRHFTLFAQRTGERQFRKDLALFRRIRKGGGSDDGHADDVPGPAGGKGALYRLRGRLLDNIGKSIVLHYADRSDNVRILHCLSLAHIYSGKGEADIVRFYLRRADKMAAKSGNYGLLDLVYSELIRHRHSTMSESPEDYIRKRRENRSRLNDLQEVDDMLALITYRLRLSQNYSAGDKTFMRRLQRTVDRLARRVDLAKSPRLRVRIYGVVSKAFLQQRNYRRLEAYVQKTMEDFRRDGLFTKEFHDTRLEMLTYLINASFKNGKVRQSLEWAGALRKAMEEFGSFLRDKYLFYYYNSLVINYSVTDVDKAIGILNEARQIPAIRKHPYYIVFVFLNLAVFRFEKKEYDGARSNIIKLRMEDGFRKLDVVFRLKIEVAELIIRYETQGFDAMNYRMGQIRREYRRLLSSGSCDRERGMLALLNALQRGRPYGDKQLAGRIGKFLNAISDEAAAEHDIINCNVWLRSKLR